MSNSGRIEIGHRQMQGLELQGQKLQGRAQKLCELPLNRNKEGQQKQ